MTVETIPTTPAGPATRGVQPTERHQQLTSAAQRFVAQAFFGTLLKQMHDSPFASEVFSGGRGGQAFSSLLDQQLTERMGSAPAARKLADTIVNRIEGRFAGTAPAAVSPSQSQSSQEVTSHVTATLRP